MPDPDELLRLPLVLYPRMMKLMAERWRLRNQQPMSISLNCLRKTGHSGKDIILACKVHVFCLDLLGTFCTARKLDALTSFRLKCLGKLH